MKVEGEGGIKRVGRSGVSWGSVSVCALWAGAPLPLWVMAVVLDRRALPTREQTASCQRRAATASAHICRS